MTAQPRWGDLELTAEVTLLLGSRPRAGSRHLEAGRLELRTDFAAELALACRGWLADIAQRSPVPYNDDPHLDQDEYLEASMPALIEQARAELPDDVSGEGDLQRIVTQAFANQNWLDPESLRQHFLFYAVAARTADRRVVGFVKQAGPQRLAKPGGWLTVFDDALQILDRPVFVLDPDIDLVLAGDQLAIIRPLAFERLCSDLQISQALVPHHVKVVTNALPTTPDTAAAIESVCQHRTRAGRLLREISSFSTEQWHARTAGRVEEVLRRRGFRREDFFNDSGELSMVPESVPTLLELLASRYFTSDFDDEQMRADKARRRT